ncbi:MAG TPA: hypothetical protein VKV26_24620 [Dehalococcoidia bacterium]|nr:hypothetical protein [Dehalococcoidia bacterium]
MTWIARALQHLPRRAGRRLFDLDVLDQWLVATLARFGDCTYRRIDAELRAIRAATPAEVVAALLKLQEIGLVQRVEARGLMLEERTFRLTRPGQRLARLLPAEPKSPTIFYL